MLWSKMSVAIDIWSSSAPQKLPEEKFVKKCFETISSVVAENIYNFLCYCKSLLALGMLEMFLLWNIISLSSLKTSQVEGRKLELISSKINIWKPIKIHIQQN